MRYVYYLDYTPTHIGSMDLFLCYLRKSLDDQLVLAFTGEPEEEPKKFLKDNGCEYIVVKNNFLEMFKKLYRFDVIITGFHKLPLLLTFLFFLLGKKHVYVHHNSFFDEQLSHRQLEKRHRLKKIKIQLVNFPIKKVICVSGFIAEELSRFGISKRKLACIHNGVDVNQSLPIQYPPSLKNHLLNDQERKNKIKCIYIGSLETYKGIDVILETATLVKDVDFYIAGDGTLKENVISESKKSKNIIYLGIIHQFSSIAKEFDFAIVPSRWHEAFCYSAVEALYANIPVIASKVGALPEVLGNKNVIFLEEITPSHLKEAIEGTLVNLKTKSISKIDHNFTIEKQTKLYTQLLGGL